MKTILKGLLVIPITQIYRLAVLIPAAIVLSSCEVIAPMIMVGALTTPGIFPTGARDQKPIPEDITTSTVSAQETLEDETGHGISGTYVSTITGNKQPLHLKESEPKVILFQNGSSINGTFGKRRGKIWGDLKDNTIKFDWLSSAGDSGSGKWTIKKDSNKINGTWFGRFGTGKWNLKKIE